MWSRNVNVEVPNELLKGMEIQAKVVSPKHPNVGVLILSKDYNQLSREIVIRLYRMHKGPVDKRFHVVSELEAFMFTNYKQAKEFLKKLPNMTGLEMLLLLNPPQPVMNLQ